MADSQDEYLLLHELALREAQKYTRLPRQQMDNPQFQTWLKKGSDIVQEREEFGFKRYKKLAHGDYSLVVVPENNDHQAIRVSYREPRPRYVHHAIVQPYFRIYEEHEGCDDKRMILEVMKNAVELEHKGRLFAFEGISPKEKLGVLNHLDMELITAAHSALRRELAQDGLTYFDDEKANSLYKISQINGAASVAAKVLDGGAVVVADEERYRKYLDERGYTPTAVGIQTLDQLRGAHRDPSQSP